MMLIISSFCCSSFFFFRGIDTSDGGSVMRNCETTWIKKLNEEGFFTFVH